MLTGQVTITCQTPTADQLPAIADVLAEWQRDPWPGHLHPGDLGWHSTVGAEQMAKDLRVWTRDGSPVVIGMLDGSDVLRLAVDPALADDQQLSDRMTRELTGGGTGIFTDDDAIVEARGAGALRATLREAGWVDDEPWMPLVMDLSAPLDATRLDLSGLRIEEIGEEAIDDWASVHWSAFRGTRYDEEARTRMTNRLTNLMTGPFANRAHHLVGYDPAGTPVAVTTVWTAGEGRPGLVEPMGVHRTHHGKGYGVSITLAGALTLQRCGASSAAVVAEASNPAALATYRSAGFRPLDQVTDLKRP